MVHRDGTAYIVQNEILILGQAVIMFVGYIMITYKNYDYLTNFQITLIIVWTVWHLTVIITETVLSCIFAYRLRKITSKVPKKAILSPNDKDEFLRRLSMWSKVRGTRKRMRRVHMQGMRCFLLVFFLIQLFLGSVMYSEFQQMITTQNRYFSDAVIKELDSFELTGVPDLSGCKYPI
jgi:hypothetical protein